MNPACKASKEADVMTTRNRAKLERQDWVLLVLAAAKGEPVTPVQLQKALFLLEKDLPQIGGENYYHFTPYAYGPFDATIYADAETLAADGYITIGLSASTYSQYKVYRATESGLQRAKALSIDKTIREKVKGIVEQVRSLSFQELVAEIYRQYPEMRKNSVFSC